MASPNDYLRLLVALPWILFCFLLDTALCLLPWMRPVRQWTLYQTVCVHTVRLVLLFRSRSRFGDRLTLKPGGERDRFEIMQPHSSKAYQGPLNHGLVLPEEIGATWTPARPRHQEDSSVKPVVALHFHGGGFVLGDGRDNDTGFLARTLLRHLRCTHVCTPQYRLANRKGGEFPAPIQDAVTAYLHLVNNLHIEATHIILSGDSAGGNIALGLLRYIKDYGEELGIPAPGAVTLWSPWVDVIAALHEDPGSSPNYKTDYVSAEFGRWGAGAISACGITELSAPYLSPLHHPFTLEPKIPMFVNAGDREVTCHDVSQFSKRFLSHGWPLHLFVSKNCPHDILLLGPLLGFGREAEEAVQNANTFFRSVSALPL